jgi:glutamine synthetase
MNVKTYKALVTRRLHLLADLEGTMAGKNITCDIGHDGGVTFTGNGHTLGTCTIDDKQEYDLVFPAGFMTKTLHLQGMESVALILCGIRDELDRKAQPIDPEVALQKQEDREAA